MTYLTQQSLAANLSVTVKVHGGNLNAVSRYDWSAALWSGTGEGERGYKIGGLCGLRTHVHKLNVVDQPALVGLNLREQLLRVAQRELLAAVGGESVEF